MKRGVTLMTLFGLFPVSADAALINWASLDSSAGNVTNPSQVAGPPDNLAANLFPTLPPGSVSLSFSGSASSYETSTLAALLGVAPALLESVDVVAFDRNPNPMGFIGFEDSRWHFEDGSNSLDLLWEAGSLASGPVVAVGSVDRFPYAAFFGLTPLSFEAGFGFLLFDLHLVGLNAESAGFRVTLSADLTSIQIPDPEAVGRLTPVPEPASFVLLAAGLMALRKRSRRASSDRSDQPCLPSAATLGRSRPN